MKLKRIFFAAFKSLLDKELELNHSCIGFVGINESGKSNILRAIDILSGNKKISLTDTPKMAMERLPSLRFEFELTKDELKSLNKTFDEWKNKNTLNSDVISISNVTLIYNILYNKTTNQEERFFSLNGLNMKDNSVFLIPNSSNDLYKIKHEEKFVPLSKAVLITESEIIDNEQHWENYEEIFDINTKIEELEKEIKTIYEKHNKQPIDANAIADGVSVQTNSDKSHKQDDSEILGKQKLIEELKLNKIQLENNFNDFNLPLILSELKNEIETITLEIDRLLVDIKNLEIATAELKKLPVPPAPEDELHKTSLLENAKNLNELIAKKNSLITTKTEKETTLSFLTPSLRDRFTKDISVFNDYFKEIFHGFSKDSLPKVVFWQHSKDYILQSQTLFSEITNKTSLNEMSRPLVNVFRIGLGIQTIDELKLKIREIQTNPNERSRSEKILNNKTNEYIKSVWENYDQELNITLEKDQIRIEIYDPKPDNGSYYNMEERSQGCQTFLSFLMTIGAEARQGVIKDTILLLDEPETHLHPSGVKFMLKELLKIADRNNTVIYATHSIFMIDRENYDRHIILKKEKEQTFLKPSNSGRIGFFMQEEVLYNALDINLSNDFSSANLYNFVFEGDGDAILYEHFYHKILKKETQPFIIKNTRFYQGGKCNDIQKYFTHKPIQLGSKWVFILDCDSAADGLKTFIQGKYKEYLNKDVFVFQYDKATKNSIIELEDILPDNFLIAAYEKAFKEIGNPIDEKEIKKIITKEEWFFNYDSVIVEKLLKDSAKKDQFTITFKETLNSKIRESLLSITNEEAFKKTFPEYFKWATDITTSISDSVKKK